ncbi:MAG: 30S ribosomal protein S7 [Tepidisphaeraceae bacterium]
MVAATGQTVVYDAFDTIAKKNKDVQPLEVFETAINNIKPYVEVRSKRVGGANYQVPMQVNKRRQQSLAIRWLLAAIRAEGGRPTSDKLADELLAAFRKEGKAMTTREQTHRMADANKAFAHFAW